MFQQIISLLTTLITNHQKHVNKLLFILISIFMIIMTVGVSTQLEWTIFDSLNARFWMQGTFVIEKVIIRSRTVKSMRV